jgi:hypothetical protein
MKCESVGWTGALRKLRAARELLRLGNQLGAGHRQSRRVQHLTYGAGGVGTFRVLVEKRSAGSDIQ